MKKNNKLKDIDITENELALIDKLYDFFISYCNETGKLVLRFKNHLVSAFKKLYRRFLVKPSRFFVRKFQSAADITRKTKDKIKNKLTSIRDFYKNSFGLLKDAFNKNPDKNVVLRIFDVIKTFFTGVSHNGNIFIKLLNYLLPAAAVVSFLFLIGYVNGLNFAVSVKYNDVFVGYISDEKVYENAETKLQSRMVYKENDEKIDVTPEFKLAIVDSKSLKSDSQLTDAIIMSSGSDVVKAIGLTIDDKFYGAVKSAAQIKGTMDGILEDYKIKNPDAEVKFTKEINLEDGLYLSNNIVEETDLVKMISSETQGDAYYTVVEGDTPIRIAAKNDLSLSELLRLNPGLDKDCLIGKQVLITKSQPFLSVSVLKNEVYDETIPYETKYVDSPKLFTGVKQVTQKGENGTNKVTAKVEYVDGVEVSREVLSKTQTKAPVDSVVYKGTKPMPTVPNFNGATSGYGLSWPVKGFYVSQGYKGDRHNGIDLARRGGAYGQPIYAAHSGTVVRSGAAGSYGNLIVVEGGGIQTWYAHCSAINVSVGDKVVQGQQIGNVGNSGRSFGAHLHFRVLVNGVQQNPANFLP